MLSTMFNNSSSAKAPSYNICNYNIVKDRDNRLETTMACIYLTIGIAAFFSNIFIDYVIWKLGLHRVAGHLFILSLSVSDLIQGILVSVVNAIELLASEERTFCRTQAWCRFSAGVSLLAILSTVYNVFVVATDRLIAVFAPLRYHNFMNERRAKTCIGMLWVYMLVWCALPSLGWAHTSTCLRPPHTICDWGLTLDHRYFLVTGILVIISVSFVAIVQTAILCVALKQMNSISAQHSHGIMRQRRVIKQRRVTPQGIVTTHMIAATPKQSQMQRTVTRRVSFIILTFAMTFIPWFVLVIRTIITGLGGQSYIYGANTLIYINSFLNPWVYATTDRAIRRQMKKCLSDMANGKIRLFDSTMSDLAKATGEGFANANSKGSERPVSLCM